MVSYRPEAKRVMTSPTLNTADAEVETEVEAYSCEGSDLSLF